MRAARPSWVSRGGPIACALAVLLWHSPPALAAVRASQASADAPAHCSKVWVGREAEFEEYLRTARIVKTEDIGLGVTKPKRVFFEPGGLVRSAAWKPIRPGRYNGYWESYQSELAAYELDKLLEMHMVPPTVERRIDGELGALVMWVENVRGWNVKQPVVGPDVMAWNREVVAMKMFDGLIANIDRNQGNVLYDAEYHLVLIDHSRAFTATRNVPVKLTNINRALYERFNTLTYDALEQALGGLMGKGELRAIVARRDRMREEIGKRIADIGERRVFLP